MQLKELRENKQLTLADVSKETGLSISMICKLERGDVKLTEKVNAILSAFYKTDVECPTSATYRKIEKLEEENAQLRKDCAKLLKQNLELKEFLAKIKLVVNRFSEKL